MSELVAGAEFLIKVVKEVYANPTDPISVILLILIAGSVVTIFNRQNNQAIIQPVITNGLILFIISLIPIAIFSTINPINLDNILILTELQLIGLTLFGILSKPLIGLYDWVNIEGKKIQRNNAKINSDLAKKIAVLFSWVILSFILIIWKQNGFIHTLSIISLIFAFYITIKLFNPNLKIIEVISKATYAILSIPVIVIVLIIIFG